MNIEKLLKKLDRQSVQRKDNHLQVGANLKTYQSIGTLNSVCDQNDKSFVLQQPTHNKSVGYRSNCSKLDGELENIQKMKNLYQSRKMRNRIMSSVQRNSIDKSAGSGGKSLEKHILKPSNTPSFNKIQKQKKTIISSDSACKNLYTEQLLQTSQSSNLPHSKVSKSKPNQIIYQYPDSNMKVDNEQPYEQQLPYFTQQSLSHIANISEDFPHDDHSYLKNKKEDFEWQNKKQSLEIDQNQQKNEKCSCQCVSRREMDNIFQKFQQKFEQLTMRIVKMERENASLKQNQFEIMCESQKYKQALEQSRQQKDRMSMELDKQKQEKQELQFLLKDVLYKRQRERMFSSKENTFRQNENKEIKAMKQNLCIQTQSTTDLKSGFTSLNKSSARQSQSKMKVQNLLHKLQIKVDRA